MRNRTPNEAWINGYPCSRIRERMETLKMSSTDLERVLIEDGVKISASAIRFWLSGYSRPDLDKIPSLARALNCSVNYLFGEDYVPDITMETICDLTGLSEKSVNILTRSREREGLYSCSALATLSFMIEQEYPWFDFFPVDAPDDIVTDIMYEYDCTEENEEYEKLKSKIIAEWHEERAAYKIADLSKNARVITEIDKYLRFEENYSSLGKHEKQMAEMVLLGEVAHVAKRLKIILRKSEKADTQ